MTGRLTIAFHGGAGTVTGSRHLVESPGGRVLVDAGLFQGLKELRLANWDAPPFEPRGLGHVLLTHAHIDHSGWLPRLVRLGYEGPVSATGGTCDLLGVMLRDSAKIQEEDAAYANRKGFSKHHPALPLYTSEDAERALARLRPVAYDTWLAPVPGVRARFRQAGHLLGSAHIEIEADGGGPRAVLSGDVGRYRMPLHADPEPPPACDLLVMESTYGDRIHDRTPVGAQVGRTLRDVLGAGGTVLVPSFAVGRAQLVTLLLRELMERGELPDVPIHIDSPMAVDATRIYARHLGDPSLDDELGEGPGRLFPRQVRFHRSVDESKALNDLDGPRIILSSSGMLTGGRVLHHLKRLLPDRRNLVLLVGYQAVGTRGRLLQAGARSLRIHGRDVPVGARWASIGGLSGHADADELVRWVRSAPSPPRRVVLVHGEPEAGEALAARLRDELGLAASVARLGEVVPVGSAG